MIFYGINPLFEALHSAYLPARILVQPGKEKNRRIQKILRLAESRGIPVETTDSLDKRCDSPAHQGIAAVAGDLPVAPLAEGTVLDSRLIMLDSIQDPHNFGAAMRVCEALGFHDVIYHRGNSSGLTPAAIKVSTGAVFHLRLLVSNLNNAVKRLKRDGYSLCVLEADAETSLYNMNVPDKFCVVVGSEGKGVRHNIVQAADCLMRIPMHGRVNSLNVSCALTAVLSELSRRRDVHEN